MKKQKWIPLMMSIFLLMLSMTAFAFEDISTEEGKDAILNLYSKGIVSGISKTSFAPNRSLSYAEAVTLYVKAFDLNMDHLRFIKAPVASDSYDKMKDDAWYANAFVIAYHNGLVFPRDLDPNATMSKEEFAHYLYQLLTAKATIPIPMIFNQFQPQKAISRAEAAVMIYNVLETYGEELKNPIVIQPKPPIKEEEIQVTTEKVNDEVNKVTLYWGEMPSPGYGLSIDSIQFHDQVATIYYTLHYPEPNKAYPTVMTKVEASTYIAAGYTIQTLQSNVYTLPYEKPVTEMPIVKPINK